MKGGHAISLLHVVKHPLLLSMAGWLCFLYSSGQGLHNETQLHLQGATVYVNGHMTNAGLLFNDGQIIFTGDWENKGSYVGRGHLEAGGDHPQAITHNDQDVHTLRASGLGAKYISGKITVTGELNLTNGIVYVSEGDTLRLKEHSSIVGGSPDSYVDGAITAEGTGYRFFPIGRNGLYAPIELLDVQGERPVYTLEVLTNAPAPTVDGVLVQDNLYWLRNPVEGSFAGSPVRLGYDAARFNDPEKIILLSGNGWDETFTVIEALDRSVEAPLISTKIATTARILMFGEQSETRTEAPFYFSTALSPDAANPDNRAVKIFGPQLSGERFRFSVFNRWGECVFETTSLGEMSVNGWDGRSFQGKQLAGGTYPYRLTGIDKSGNTFESKGVITIVR